MQAAGVRSSNGREEMQANLQGIIKVQPPEIRIICNGPDRLSPILLRIYIVQASLPTKTAQKYQILAVLVIRQSLASVTVRVL